MTTALLSTKLYTPPIRPELVSRRRLIERLMIGLSGKLTLISAPAGFGKTTLISEWISQSDIPFGWISLDRNDNDPGRFLAYLIASLQAIELEVDPEPIKLIQNQEQGQVETILNGLINQIVDFQRQFAVVLDDYHLIQDNDVHQILIYLLEHLPANFHIVIATRADPPLPVARLRARGELTELRSADLRFLPMEGDAFLNQVFDLNLSSSDVEKLVSRTDGWIAGLQMASIALRGRQDTSEYIQRFSGSHDYIVDFLTSEVLEQQPDHIQEFLLKTAILNQLTCPLCEAITERNDCGKILRYLRQKNIFLTALDDLNQWFAYHQLFRDLLTQQLYERHPEEISGLFLKASEWCEKYGAVTDAIDYALQGEHFDRAADLVDFHAQATIQQSEIMIFIRWVEMLPEAVVFDRSNLSILYAWTLLISNRQPETAARYLDQVVPTDDILLGKQNAVRAIQAAARRNISKSIELSQQALQQLPEDDYFFRQIAGWNLSAALFLSGDADGGTDVLKDVARVSIASGNRMVAVVALCRLGNIRMQQGDLFQAHDYYQHALDIALDGRKKPLPAASEALLGLGKIQWEWYQYKSATQILSEGLELSKRWREVASVEGHITLAQLLLSQGHVDSANRAMEDAKGIASKKIITETGKQYIDLQEAYLQLRQGNFPFAKAWADKCNLEKNLQIEKLEPSQRTGADLIRDLELGVYARILLADKRFDDVLKLLSNLLPEFSRLGHLSKIIETNILIAVANQALGNQKETIESLKTALDFAAPAEYIRIFIEDGYEVSHLVRQIHRQGYLPHFTQKIRAASPLVTTQTEKIKTGVKLIEPLSEREIEILCILESELNVPEIAANIHISVSTLRTHIRNIYRKLDTHSRFETVSKAKDLKLI